MGSAPNSARPEPHGAVHCHRCGTVAVRATHLTVLNIRRLGVWLTFVCPHCATPGSNSIPAAAATVFRDQYAVPWRDTEAPAELDDPARRAGPWTDDDVIAVYMTFATLI